MEFRIYFLDYNCRMSFVFMIVITLSCGFDFAKSYYYFFLRVKYSLTGTHSKHYPVIS